jgi:hypothetical protein
MLYMSQKFNELIDSSLVPSSEESDIPKYKLMYSRLYRPSTVERYRFSLGMTDKLTMADFTCNVVGTKNFVHPGICRLYHAFDDR